MCLLAETIKPKKATRDIVCYKFPVKRLHLESPWTHFQWELNKEYKADRSGPRWSPRDIKDGYFHSYKTKDQAIRGAYEFTGPAIDVTYVYECIIPKGTYYFEGIHSGGHQGYASKKIIVKKKIY